MATTFEKAELLKKAHLFSGLSIEELELISSHVTIREFNKGQIILHEEDTNKFMYSVLDGEVKVYALSEDGKESIVAFHGAGESFGEVSLIDQQTTPATVTAIEKSMVMIIGRQDFFDMVESNKKVMHQLLLMLSFRLRHSLSQVRMLHLTNAAHRIKASIKDIAAERGEKRPKGVLLPLRLTHQNIADMTGLTRETVTRVIDKWKKSGLVTVDSNRHMLITNDFFKESCLL